MIFNINHQTIYEFSSEVFLEPHFLRLYPRRTAYTELQDFQITISPKPTGLRLQEDEEGNLIHFCWFEAMTKTLSIETEFIIKSSPFNPFDFLVYPGELNKLPFYYTDEQHRVLHIFLQPLEISSLVREYTQNIESDSGFETMPFLLNLTRKIHADIVVTYRQEGAPYHPNDTFKLKAGSCRDLAWMQINILRARGFAARFVSGYYFFATDNPDFELHGWLEVFIPGAGWIGYDPSHGIMTGNNHIPLVTGSNVESTMPVSGTYRGNAGSTLSTTVNITAA